MRTWVLTVLVAVLVLTTWGCSNGSQRADPAARPTPGVPMRAEDVTPLQPGDAAPSLTLGSPEGTPVELAEIYADGPTMLIFYRGSWCPYCTEHLREVAQREAQLREMGVRIVAVSPDRPEVIARHVVELNPHYAMLSDSDASAARAFGVAFRVDDPTVELYRGYGIDLEEASGEDHQVLPVPAVFLVDDAGIVRFAHWNADYQQRLSGEELLDAARAVTGQ